MTQYIDTTSNLDDLALVKRLKKTRSPFVPIVFAVYERVKELLNNRIQAIFPKYTLHNAGHSFRIMEYMNKLIEDSSKLSDLEICLLICSALCHDIGMAVSDENIAKIRSDDFEFADFRYSSMLKLIGDDNLALQEYVRRIHSSLSAKYIREELKLILTIPKLINLDFAEELALICESHTNDFDWIKAKLKVHEVKGDYQFNSQFIACALRLGDILDIDSNRTPYTLYKNILPTGLSDEEWKQHFVILNNDKIIKNLKTGQKVIVFHGKATNADIHRKVLNYIDWVKTELSNSVALVNGMPQQYGFSFDTNPEINIQAEGYTFSGYKMTLKFQAISSLLMGEKIYGSKSLGLRELIQNSIDACRLREESEKSKAVFGLDPYTPKIKIILDPTKNLAIIKDNGIGMSLEVIKKHFLNIGVSYYNSFEFLLKDSDYKPIGNFGIGFLSCFMLSNDVSVTTRHYNLKNKYKIDLKKGNEWTSLTESEDVMFDGTEVSLNYNQFFAVFENKVIQVHEFLNKYFLTDGIDVKLINNPDILNINNPIKPPPIEKGNYLVDFGSYFSEIEGYAIIKKKNEFIKAFDDIEFDGDVYLYDDDGQLKEVDIFTTLNIHDFVVDKELRYLKVPLIEDDTLEDFNNGMKFTNDDIDEVVEKLDSKLKWISIIYKKALQEELDYGTLGPRKSLNIPLEFKQLVDLGHDKDSNTKISIETVKLFEGIQNELYMPFDDKERNYYSYYSDKSRKELFIRDVLIKDFNLNLPSTATIFEVQTLVINIKSRKFIPDISRNNVDYQTRSSINYLLGRILHVAGINLLELDEDEKSTLRKFVDSYYNEVTEFEIT